MSEKTVYLVLLEELNGRYYDIGTGTGMVLGVYENLQDAVRDVISEYGNDASSLQVPFIYKLTMNTLDSGCDLNHTNISLVWGRQ
jgi:hypothetical protein